MKGYLVDLYKLETGSLILATLLQLSYLNLINSGGIDLLIYRFELELEEVNVMSMVLYLIKKPRLRYQVGFKCIMYFLLTSIQAR